MPESGRMLPCQLEFFSYLLMGEVFQHKDSKAGEVVFYYADPEVHHYKPISYFDYDVSKTFQIEKLGRLISRFSGVPSDLLSFTATNVTHIWLPTLNIYRKRMLGRVQGCGVHKEFSYESYSFGFSSSTFFFDPRIKGGDPYSMDQKKPLILDDAKEEIISLYKAIMEGSPIPSEIAIDDFFLGDNPSIGGDGLCWQCYFTAGA